MTSTTAYVATVGGHVSELVELADRLPADDELWITNDSPQTRDLLAGRRVALVPFVGERDLRGVLRAVPTARRLLGRHRIGRVVSTGSALALGYLPTAAAMGLDVHYIESSTRVDAPSMTGRVLARVPGIRCWWQYPDPPPHFTHLGGVYDRYTVEPAPDHRTDRPPKRIVVTVGTTDRDFRRLIARLVEILPADADVLWQTGASSVADLGIDARSLVPERELVTAIAGADVVVTHAGAGSLAMALRAGKVPVFVPRRADHDEHLDDHQGELAAWADRAGLAVAAEADQVELDHLQTASRLTVRTVTTRKLLLDDCP